MSYCESSPTGLHQYSDGIDRDGRQTCARCGAKTPWLVLHHQRGGRLGSLALTESNLREMRSLAYMSLLQVDINGTEHWRIDGHKKQRRIIARKRVQA